MTENEGKKRDRREYYIKNRDKILAYHNVYRKENPEKIKHYYKQNRDVLVLAQKKYRKEHRAEINERVRKYKVKSVQYRLTVRLRGCVWSQLKGLTKGGSSVQDLGCTVQELKSYLESKFQDGMTWENWGTTGWHIDHIKPLYSFDLTNREQFLEACHYTNLQPLWAVDNLKKGIKVGIY